MTSTKNLLIGLILMLLMTLCACGTTESSEFDTMEVAPAILSMIEAIEHEEAVVSDDAIEADAIVPVRESVTEPDTTGTQETVAGVDAKETITELDAAGTQETATEQLTMAGSDAAVPETENVTDAQSTSVDKQSEDLLLKKLNGASVEGNIPQAARDAFYGYLSARDALFEEVEQWNWSLKEDADSTYTRGWISLNFDGTPDGPGAYYGTSIYYRPDTGKVLNFEELDAYIRSMETEVVTDPAISGKLRTAFSTLGSYDQEAFDAMVTFLDASEGSWMWEKCQNWNWSCSYDSSTDRYTLECVGPQETDGTRGVQYLVAQGSQIISYASSYIAAPESSEPQADDVTEVPVVETETETEIEAETEAEAATEETAAP